MKPDSRDRMIDLLVEDLSPVRPMPALRWTALTVAVISAAVVFADQPNIRQFCCRVWALIYLDKLKAETKCSEDFLPWRY